nr:unnamed protein product [Callosobruchus analis]
MFSAPWCSSCKKLRPTFQDLTKKYPQIQFVDVNIDEMQEMATEMGIASIPAVFFYREGVVVETVFGTNIKEVVKKTEEYVGKVTGQKK